MNENCTQINTHISAHTRDKIENVVGTRNSFFYVCISNIQTFARTRTLSVWIDVNDVEMVISHHILRRCCARRSERMQKVYKRSKYILHKINFMWATFEMYQIWMRKRERERVGSKSQQLFNCSSYSDVWICIGFCIERRVYASQNEYVYGCAHMLANRQIVSGFASVYGDDDACYLTCITHVFSQ